jgi:hypothetical protein
VSAQRLKKQTLTPEELVERITPRWELFSMFELHEIMRQKDDKPWAELLARVREGLQTADDVAMILERNVSEQEALTKLGNVEGLVISAPLNKRVDWWNGHEFARLMARGAKTETFQCCDSFPGARSAYEKEDAKSLVDHKDKKSPTGKDTSGARKNLVLAVGMQVDMMSNVDVK